MIFKAIGCDQINEEIECIFLYVHFYKNEIKQLLLHAITL